MRHLLFPVGITRRPLSRYRSLMGADQPYRQAEGDHGDDLSGDKNGDGDRGG
jgi:hypothetical protein